MKTLIRSLAFLVVSSSFLMTALLFLADHGTFSRALLESAGKIHRLEEFQSHFLTLSKFRLLRYVSLASSFLLALLFLKLSRRLESAAFLFQRGLGRLGAFLKETACAAAALDRFEKTLLFGAALLLAGYRAYQLVNVPPSYDEAFTYLNYSSKGILVSASHYQSPNNHIFFSILTNFAGLLPLDPLVAIRLPNFLLGLMMPLIVFSVTRKRLGTSAGLVAAVLFSFSFPISLYSIHARGYLLYALFSLAGIHSLLALVLEGESRFHWTVLTLSSILGFYTIPTFFYPYASLLLFGFLAFVSQKRGHAVRSLFLSALGTGLTVALLYFPVVLMNGFHLARQYGFLERNDGAAVQAEIIPYFRRVTVWLAGGNPQGPMVVGGGVLASAVALFASSRQIRTISLLSLFSLFLAPCFVLLQRVFPHERTWIYLVFVLLLGLSAFLTLMPRGVLRLAQLSSAAFSVVSILSFKSFYERTFKFDFPVAGFVKTLDAKEIRSVYSDYDHFEVLYRYDRLRHGRRPEIDSNIPLDPEKSYDLIVVSQRSSLVVRPPEGYRLIHETPLFKAFMRKGAE